jgi:valyl-tRNA synthetase
LHTALSDVEVDFIDIDGETQLTLPPAVAAKHAAVSSPPPPLSSSLSSSSAAAASSAESETASTPTIQFGVMHTLRYRVINDDGNAVATAAGEGDVDDEFIFVATTRPETVFGDVAVAVSSTDARYAHLLPTMNTLEGGGDGATTCNTLAGGGVNNGDGDTGLIRRYVEAPLTKRRIPIIVDDTLVDPLLGTGAVKVTPAHDVSDFECGERYNATLSSSSPLRLPMLRVIDDDGTFNAHACAAAASSSSSSSSLSSSWHGQHRLLARASIVAAMRAEGSYVSSKPHPMRVPVCSRSGDFVEPAAKPQWFVDTQSMAAHALTAVTGDNDDAVQSTAAHSLNAASATSSTMTMRLSSAHDPALAEGIDDDRDGPAPTPLTSTSTAASSSPEHVATWRDFLAADKSRPWCVSRQLWWGHRIPAYRVVVDVAAAAAAAGVDATSLFDTHTYVHMHTHASNAKDDNGGGGDESGEDGAWVVATSSSLAHARALATYPHLAAAATAGVAFSLKQDDDVLDTWFSSALLPLSAHGWPLVDPAHPTSSSTSSSLSSSTSLSSSASSSASSGDVTVNAHACAGASATLFLSSSSPPLYPLSLMETGGDILFFWVARMAMLCSTLQTHTHTRAAPTPSHSSTPSLSSLSSSSSSSSLLSLSSLSSSLSLSCVLPPPFPVVVLHPMVRDATGAKMSKSSRNVIDPMTVIDGSDGEASVVTATTTATAIVSGSDGGGGGGEDGGGAGADALRLALCLALRSQDANSVRLRESDVAQCRMFGNKVWQLVRFAAHHLDKAPPLSSRSLTEDPSSSSSSSLSSSSPPLSSSPLSPLLLANRWVLLRLDAAVAAQAAALTAPRYQVGSITSRLLLITRLAFAFEYVLFISLLLDGAAVGTR